MKNGWFAFALLLAACAGAVVRPVMFPQANAAGPTQRCDWRYLTDLRNPDIPEEMESAPMSREWSAMSEAGYRLVNSEGVFYLFERCSSAQ